MDDGIDLRLLLKTCAKLSYKACWIIRQVNGKREGKNIPSGEFGTLKDENDSRSYWVVLQKFLQIFVNLNFDFIKNTGKKF